MALTSREKSERLRKRLKGEAVEPLRVGRPAGKAVGRCPDLAPVAAPSMSEWEVRFGRLEALLKAVDRRLVAIEDRPASVPATRVQSLRDQVLGVGMNPAMRAVVERQLPGGPGSDINAIARYPFPPAASNVIPFVPDDDPGNCA